MFTHSISRQITKQRIVIRREEGTKNKTSKNNIFSSVNTTVLKGLRLKTTNVETPQKIAQGNRRR